MAKLHTEFVAPSNRTPTRWLAFVHGIYGSGANWRSIARHVITGTTDWGAVLIDLRGHGRSPSGEPPHSIAACANDLAETFHTLAGDGKPVAALCGHSFGGKVTLAMAQTDFVPSLRIVLDASPSAKPQAWQTPGATVPAVLAMLEGLPKTWRSRDAFVDAVVAAGQPRAIAQWLGLSVQRVADGREDGYALTLVLPVVRRLLEDYFALDAWQHVNSRQGPLWFVLGSKSEALSGEDRGRLHQADVTVHEIDAGHWLHVDAPDALNKILITAVNGENLN